MTIKSEASRSYLQVLRHYSFRPIRRDLRAIFAQPSSWLLAVPTALTYLSIFAAEGVVRGPLKEMLPAYANLVAKISSSVHDLAGAPHSTTRPGFAMLAMLSFLIIFNLIKTLRYRGSTVIEATLRPDDFEDKKISKLLLSRKFAMWTINWAYVLVPILLFFWLAKMRLFPEAIKLLTLPSEEDQVSAMMSTSRSEFAILITFLLLHLSGLVLRIYRALYVILASAILVVGINDLWYMTTETDRMQQERLAPLMDQIDERMRSKK